MAVMGGSIFGGMSYPQYGQPYLQAPTFQQGGYGPALGNIKGGVGVQYIPTGNATSPYAITAAPPPQAPVMAPPPQISASQIYADLAQAEGSLPSSVQLGAGSSAADVAAARNNYLATAVNPAVADLRAEMARLGQDQGSFGAARISALEAAGQREADAAAQNVANNQVDRWAKQRDAFFGPLGNLLSNQASNAGTAANYATSAADLAYKAQQAANQRFDNRVSSYGTAALNALRFLPSIFQSGKKMFGSNSALPSLANSGFESLWTSQDPWAGTPYQPII